MSYAECPARGFRLPHRWKVDFWDKFGTGVKDVPVEVCRYCGTRRSDA